jgi:hypothetical protein
VCVVHEHGRFTIADNDECGVVPCENENDGNKWEAKVGEMEEFEIEHFVCVSRFFLWKK